MENKFNNFEKNEVTIKELFFIIKSNIRYIYISLFAFLLLSIIYITIVRPIYSSTGSILIEDENSSMSSIFDVGLSSNKNYLENEVEVLKSRTTSERTIESLLNSPEKNNIHLFNTKKFEDSFLTSSLRNILFLDWNQELIIDIDNNINDTLYNQFVDNLRKKITISNVRNTDVLNVSYSSYSAKESALIVNTIIDIYKKRDQEWASGEMSHLKIFLSEQLNLKEIELNKIEQKLKDFQEKEHIYGLDDNSNLLLNQLTVVESDYYNTKAKKIYY